MAGTSISGLYMVERYSFSTSINTVGAFVERLLADESTLRADEPSPHPPGHDILVNLDDPNRIRVRHAATGAQTPSPILEVTLHPAPHGLNLTCEMLPAHASFSAAERAHLKKEDEDDYDEERSLPGVLLNIGLQDWDELFLYALWVVARPLVWVFYGLRWIVRRWQHRSGMALYAKKIVEVIEHVANAEDNAESRSAPR